LPTNREECRLLFSMGWETANVHLGNRTVVKNLRKHMSKQKSNWLHTAATQMVGAVRQDWQVWRKSGVV
jgi:hypothetical protein